MRRFIRTAQPGTTGCGRCLEIHVASGGLQRVSVRIREGKVNMRSLHRNGIRERPIPRPGQSCTAAWTK
jgi:hypothetical protein